MDKETLVNAVRTELEEANVNHELVNFWNNEVEWQQISEIAVEVMRGKDGLLQETETVLRN
jgi:hypothetical protein